MTRAAPSHPPAAPRLGLILAVAAYLVSAAAHVGFGGINPDEGFYAVAARAVMQGEVPYRDFGYTQTPWLPYGNGVLMSLTGFGLFEQRAINGLWGLLALTLAAGWVAATVSRAWGGALVVAFALMPGWMYFIHLGKTYGLTAGLVMLGTVIFVRQPPGWKKQWLLAWVGGLAVGCRLPAAPFFAVLWLVGAGEQIRGGVRPGREIAISVAGLVAAAGLLIGPFWWSAPEAFRFWVLEFHLRSVPQRGFLGWREIVGVSPLLWAGVGVALGALIERRTRPRGRAAWVVLGAAVALALNLFPRGAFGEYAVPFLLPFATGLIVLLAPIARAWSPGRKAATGALLLAVHVGVPPLLAPPGEAPGIAALASRWLPPGVAGYDSGLPGNLQRARSAVEELLPPEAPLIGPHLILAAETGRPVPRKLRLGPFSMTMDFPEEQADRLHLLTYPEFRCYLTDPGTTLLAFSTGPGLNYAWSMPSFRNPPREVREGWLEILRRDYRVVAEGSTFLLLARTPPGRTGEK